MNAEAAPEAAPSDALLVLVTTPDAAVAEHLGRTLVEERLAACVNIVPGLRSIYSWQGVVQDEAEVLCLVKTRRALFPVLRDRITALHPYEVPEVLGISPVESSTPYLQWLLAATATAPR